MRKNIRIGTLILMVLFYTTNIWGQDKIIRGIVTTLENVPLTGVDVKVKSTGQVVKTDTLGRFYASCKSVDKLIVSSVGFYTRKVKIKSPVKFAAVNLIMLPPKKGRSYAIGYDNVLDDNKIGAVGNVNQDDFEFSVYNDIYDLIKGRIPGVAIENGEVIIRGFNSINSSSAATIIVDGTKVNTNYLRSIKPGDVKNISVIKDGSAAIYGFQGSNGVLIIETKSADLKVR